MLMPQQSLSQMTFDLSLVTWNTTHMIGDTWQPYSPSFID